MSPLVGQVTTVFMSQLGNSTSQFVAASRCLLLQKRVHELQVLKQKGKQLSVEQTADFEEWTNFILSFTSDPVAQRVVSLSKSRDFLLIAYPALVRMGGGGGSGAGQRERGVVLGGEGQIYDTAFPEIEKESEGARRESAGTTENVGNHRLLLLLLRRLLR